MKYLVLLAALGLAGCGYTPGQQLVIAGALAQGGCILADVVTGTGVSVTAITLPANTDPAASKTLNRWKAGQSVSQNDCAKLAGALQQAGQQIIALEVKGTIPGK